MKEFFKKDLENRMVIECRNGYRYMVIDNILVGDGGFIELLNIDDNLKYTGYSKLDIMKVYDKIYRWDLLKTPKYMALLWERSCPCVNCEKISIDCLNDTCKKFTDWVKQKCS